MCTWNFRAYSQSVLTNDGAYEQFGLYRVASLLHVTSQHYTLPDGGHVYGHSQFASTASGLQPLMEAGLDSIGAVELRNAVSAAFGMELPATATFDYPSAEALATYIAGKTGVADAEHSAWTHASFVAVSAPDSATYIQQIAQDLADIVSGKPDVADPNR